MLSLSVKPFIAQSSVALRGSDNTYNFGAEKKRQLKMLPSASVDFITFITFKVGANPLLTPYPKPNPLFTPIRQFFTDHTFNNAQIIVTSSKRL